MTTANTAAGIIRDRIIAAGGALPWAEVMRLALYEPGAGYYRRGVRRIGRGGDFYTSVSVGPVFGELLGLFVAHAWRAMGSPSGFRVIEQGAHDGTLATDVLQGIRRNEPALFEIMRYVIVEPDADHRAAQSRTLGTHAEKLFHAENLATIGQTTMPAVFVCNELPDAMPVHRVQFSQGAWRELHVRADANGGLEFFPAPPSSARLADELSAIGREFPEGFTLEVNLAMLDWIREVAEAPFQGPVLILDYGHAAEDYFSQQRSNGSLRRYRSHQTDDRVLEDLGACDLTANINFTRLAQEALAAGMEIVEFIEQGRFLTRLFAETAAGGHATPDAPWQRQFQSLVHPGIMGRSFHSLVLASGVSAEMFTSTDARDAARRRLGL